MHAVSAQPMNADINVTPLLDVLLVLVIIFLASMTARKAMDVQLPLPRVISIPPANTYEVR